MLFVLPFALYKQHKSNSRAMWKRRGIKIHPDDFDYVYNEYITATHCDLCKKLYPNSKDRHIDHNHETGEVRNIVCNKCNSHKHDRKIYNNTGHRYISRCVNSEYKLGYHFSVIIMRNGENICCTSRTTIEEAIKYRDEFLKENPEIYT